MGGPRTADIIHGGDLPNHDSQTKSRVIAAIVRHLQEDLSCGSLLAGYTHRDHHDDETSNVEENEEVLNDRQPLCAPDVERGHHGRYEHRQEARLPQLGGEGWVSDRHGRHHQLGGEDAVGSRECLPAQCTEPPGRIAGNLLYGLGRELRDPMIPAVESANI